MQRQAIIPQVLCLVFLLPACSKSGKETGEQSVSFQVLEYKTNMPLPGVQIKFYRCSDYDPVFGCRAKENFESITTGQDGKASVSQTAYSKANEGILFLKDGYFTTEGSAGTTYLNRQGTVNIRIVPDTTNYSGNYLAIFAANDRYRFQVLDPIPVPTVPVEMTIKAIDGQVNTFKWVIGTSVYLSGGVGAPIKIGEISNISIPYNGRVIINL